MTLRCRGMVLLVLLLVSGGFCARALAQNTHQTLPSATSSTFNTTLQNFLRVEDANRTADLTTSRGWVVTGCLASNSGSKVLGSFACTGYAANGYYATQTSTGIDLGASPGPACADTDLGWVILTDGLTVPGGNFVQSGSSKYWVDCASSTQPTTPSNAALLFAVSIASGATQVVDLRSLAPELPARANAHGLPTFAQEREAWWGDGFAAYVVSGCLHATSGTTAATLASCRTYMKNTTVATAPRLLYVDEPVSRTITYTAGAGTYWLIAHAEMATTVSGWTRVQGTHYLWQLGASQPALPDAAVLLARVTVAGGAITAVQDWRRSSPTGRRSVTDKMYSADATGATNSVTAFQAALNNARDVGGDTVYVPAGIYRLDSRVTIDQHSQLACTRGSTILRAGATITTELIHINNTALDRCRNCAITDCILDGAGLAAWGIGISGGNGVLIADNHGTSFTAGFIHSSFTDNDNFEQSVITRNYVRAGDSFGFPGGIDTPVFIHGHGSLSNLGAGWDEITISDNTHVGVQTWSIILDQAERFFIDRHHVVNNSEGYTGGILVTNSGADSGLVRVKGNGVIRHLTQENDAIVPTPVGVRIDCNYSTGGAVGRIPNMHIEGIRSGQTGTTDNIVVDLIDSGTNCELINTVIREPRKDTDDTNLKIQVGTGVLYTAIYYHGSNGRLDNIVVDSGTLTTVNDLNAANGISIGEAPAATLLDWGVLTRNNADNRFWTVGGSSALPTYVGGANVERLVMWLTSAVQSAELGRLRAHTVYLRASITVTEAWNSSGTDEIRCGTGTAPVLQQIFALADVSTTGHKTTTDTTGVAGTITPGVRLGYSDTSNPYNCEYVNGGTEPTTGKAIIIVEFASVPSAP